MGSVQLDSGVAVTGQYQHRIFKQFLPSLLRRVFFVAVVLVMVTLSLGSQVASAASSVWSITPSLNPGAVGDALAGVSCVSTTFCAAVGGQTAYGGANTDLIEMWDGTNWTVSPSPDPGTYHDGLTAVSCASASFCVAVGNEGSTGFYDTLIVEWDGTSWFLLPSPSPGDMENYLNGVSCLSPDQCMAVGAFQNSVDQSERTLAELWNGTDWTVTPSPDPGVSAGLNGVSCTTSPAIPTSCIAVGGAPGSGSTEETALWDSWEGTNWTVESGPSTSSAINDLDSVSCYNPMDCVAVGYQYSTPIPFKSLAETWNGTNVAISPSLSPGPKVTELTGISCVSPVNCVAVGNESGSGPVGSLVENWDGMNWSVTPTPGSNDDPMRDVSCVDSTDCIAVGGYGFSLAEIGSSAPPSATPEASSPLLFVPAGLICIVGATYCYRRRARLNEAGAT